MCAVIWINFHAKYVKVIKPTRKRIKIAQKRWNWKLILHNRNNNNNDFNLLDPIIHSFNIQHSLVKYKIQKKNKNKKLTSEKIFCVTLVCRTICLCIISITSKMNCKCKFFPLYSVHNNGNSLTAGIKCELCHETKGKIKFYENRYMKLGKKLAAKK